MNNVITRKQQLFLDRRHGDLSILTPPAFEAFRNMYDAPRQQLRETISQGLRRRTDVVIAASIGVLTSSIGLPWAMSELGATKPEAASMSVLTTTMIVGGSIALHGYLGDRISQNVLNFPK